MPFNFTEFLPTLQKWYWFIRNSLFTSSALLTWYTPTIPSFACLLSGAKNSGTVRHLHEPLTDSRAQCWQHSLLTQLAMPLKSQNPFHILQSGRIPLKLAIPIDVAAVPWYAIYAHPGNRPLTEFLNKFLSLLIKSNFLVRTEEKKALNTSTKTFCIMQIHFIMFGNKCCSLLFHYGQYL